MEQQEWEQIQDIFGAVADLPANRRQQAVDQYCGGDPHLAAGVLALLREDQKQQPMLDADGAGFVQKIAEVTLSADHLHFLVERRIGPYRLLRLLGEGGMGVVYLAERIDIGGLVAIKLLRDAWLSPMRRERFMLEQRTLVQLSHPSIARIYDASTMEDGTPWFAMEYADGVPITEYLRARGGSVVDDLRVFSRVCEAVQYAHSHAVIHRDLKPSNILVTAAGEVKLLDFGIAKQMDAEAAEGARTVTSLRLLTPAYAAPEQGNGGSVGIFTDVYSLGVLLYEILTGQLPGSADARAGQPPERPSALTRRDERPQLSRRQWADLDVLCLTALQAEPERRYRSVDVLIRDVKAYLEGRVLEARPSSLAYVAGKFIRRNRLALASVAVSLAVLVAAALFFTVRLARARDAAVAEAARTARIQRFTENLLEGGDAEAGPTADLKVSELLTRGQAEAESLASDPRMQVSMLTTLGSVYQKLGRLDEAETLLQKALALERRAPGPPDRQYAETLIAMGLLRKDQRHMDEAEKLLRQALALEQQTLRKDDPAFEHALWALGSTLALHGNYTEAGQLLEEAARQGLRSPVPTAQLADDLSGLGDVNFYRGRYDAAKELNERALAIRERLFGEQHASVADLLNTLGAVAQNQGRYDDAVTYYTRALAIAEAWYGPNHPAVADNLIALSQSLVSKEQYDRAQVLVERALAIERNVHGQNDSSVANALNQLGILAEMQKKEDEAERYFLAALAIWRRIYGEHHQFIGLSYANLSTIYLRRNQFEAAEEMCRKALRVYGEAIPGGNLSVAVAHIRLGRVLLREGKYSSAEPETLAGYRYLSTHIGLNDTYLLAARNDLVEIESKLDKPELAARYRVE